LKVRVLRGAPVFDSRPPTVREFVFRCEGDRVKLILEFLVAIILHPIALLLMLINLLGRTDLDSWKKVIWALIGLLWGLGPILYILVGDGTLW
jgi:hypothetical protein